MHLKEKLLGYQPSKTGLESYLPLASQKFNLPVSIFKIFLNWQQIKLINISTSVNPNEVVCVNFFNKNVYNHICITCQF